MNVTIFRANDGKILRMVDCPVGMAGLQCGEGEDWIEGSYPDNAYFVAGYVATPMPPSPSPAHVFDYATKQWADPRTLAEVKAEKRKAITARRVAEDQRFEWQGKWFQADEAAWKQITAVHGWVVARNELPPGFLGQWKAEDNTYASIPDVDAWWSFYGAAIARGAANFAHSEARKAALDACTTVAEVDDFSPW